MVYKLVFDRRFMRQLESLPGDLRSLTRRIIASLANDPHPHGSKELDGHQGFFRLWIPRNHRLVYQLDEDNTIIELLYVGPKTPDLYNRLDLGRKEE